MTLTPAYGRDYKSIKEVKAAWDANVDFMITGMHPDSGRYINKTDAIRFGNERDVSIRYKKLTMQVIIKIDRSAPKVQMAPKDDIAITRNQMAELLNFDSIEEAFDKYQKM